MASNQETTVESTKSERTRLKIYETALRLFRERSFDKTTLRDIAQEAGVALGTSYYYFPSKEAIVLDYYAQSQRDFADKSRKIFAQTKDFKERLRACLTAHFIQQSEHRELAAVLASVGMNPRNPLSPFSEATSALRESSIQIFAEAIKDTKVGIPADVLPHLPYLLWLYHMGILFFWIQDKSPGQKRTNMLLEGSLEIILKLIKLSKAPLLSSFRKSLVRLLESLRVN